MTSGYVLLDDGTRFDGWLHGAAATVVGEIVFTTAMSGYQEAVTDPSFSGQIITFTYPHVGNYGACELAMESDRAHARAIISAELCNSSYSQSRSGWVDWLEQNDVTAISGVDTRSLVLHIRERGAMLGGIFPVTTTVEEAHAAIAVEPAMVGRNLLADVISQSECAARSDHGLRLVALDTGIKRSIINQLSNAGALVELFASDSEAENLIVTDPDGIFLGPGPGDPAVLDRQVETVSQLIGSTPLFGICLGHQLLGRALGLKTFKLRYGHRGANHPVKELSTGRVVITSQNHGFAVELPPGFDSESESIQWETPFGTAEVTHLSLYDGTVEGIRLLDLPVSSVQYHPEASPGPHDSHALLTDFVATVRANAKRAAEVVNA